MEGDAFTFILCGGMAKPVAPDRAHGERQNMAQVAADELDAGNAFHTPYITVGAVFPGKRDRALVEGEDTGVADGSAADIGAEILDSPFTVAKALEMHAPVFLPNRGINGWQVGVFLKSDELAKFLMEEMTEGASQHWLWHQEAGTLDAHNVALRIDARSWHDAVDMRMEEQTLVPGVQDHGEPALVGPEPAWVGKAFRESPGCRRKEELIELSGSRAKEEWAELFGQREGDHEVGSADAFAEFPFHPLSGGLFAALGAGPMVAGMIGELSAPTFGAGMEMPSHDRHTTMGKRPDGTPPRSSLLRMIPQVVRQKAAQRPDHGGTCQAARELSLPGQAAAESLHQGAAVFVASVGDMQIHHRGVDLLVSEQCLHGMQTCSGFDEMGCEAVTKGVERGIGNVEFLAGDYDQTLERTHGHRFGGAPHATRNLCRRASSASDIGEK